MLRPLLLRGPLTPPVSLDPVPATAFMTPVSRDPLRSSIGRPRPVAGHPDVALAIPAVMACDPNPACVRPGAGTLHDRRRRTDADVDMLRKCGRQAQERCRSDEKQLLHCLIFLSSKKMYGACEVCTRPFETRFWPWGCGNMFSQPGQQTGSEQVTILVPLDGG